MSTKTAQLAYRLTPEEKSKLESIAKDTKVPAGQIVGILVSEYIAAKENHGNQVFFPPKYHTFESIKIQEEIDANSGNSNIKQKAG
jgi:hypothetical protein